MGYIISKNLQWARPFIKAAAQVVSLKDLQSISGKSMLVDDEGQEDGHIVSSSNKYKIFVATSDIEFSPISDGFKIEGKEKYKWMVLEVLAHELAHLKEWNHTAEHAILTATLLLKFCDVLKRLKIKDYMEFE